MDAYPIPLNALVRSNQSHTINWMPFHLSITEPIEAKLQPAADGACIQTHLAPIPYPAHLALEEYEAWPVVGENPRLWTRDKHTGCRSSPRHGVQPAFLSEIECSIQDVFLKSKSNCFGPASHSKLGKHTTDMELHC